MTTDHRLSNYLGKSLSRPPYPNTIHQIITDCVLSCDLMSKIGKMMFESAGSNRAILIRFAGKIFDFLKKKKKIAYLPTHILNLKKWEPRHFFIMA